MDFLTIKDDKMKLFSFSLAVLLLSNVAFAFPIGNFDALNTIEKDNGALDPNYDFNGIIKLSNCSGSVIKLSGMPMAAKAIAMTNGHCLGGAFCKPLTNVCQFCF